MGGRNPAQLWIGTNVVEHHSCPEHNAEAGIELVRGLKHVMEHHGMPCNVHEMILTPAAGVALHERDGQRSHVEVGPHPAPPFAVNLLQLLYLLDGYRSGLALSPLQRVP